MCRRFNADLLQTAALTEIIAAKLYDMGTCDRGLREMPEALVKREY
jgi:hypothetical protein